MTIEDIAYNAVAVADDSPVFEGTLVPVKELHDYMREDWNLYGLPAQVSVRWSRASTG